MTNRIEMDDMVIAEMAMNRLRLVFAVGALVLAGKASSGEIVGVTVTPHTVESSLRYRKPRDPELAAKVQLFVRGSVVPGKFDGKTPTQLLESNEWAWHDFAAATKSPEDAVSVWTFNGKSSRWGIDRHFSVDAPGLGNKTVAIAAPQRWIAAITFLSAGGKANPDTIVVHVVNDSDREMRVSSLRMWLPRNRASWQTLYANAPMPTNLAVGPHDRGYVKLSFNEPLPLTYAAVEISTDAGPLWEHLRIKTESFDIGGGWVGDRLTHEEYLRLLMHMHINSGQIQAVPGYTDNPKLYDRYPIKLTNRLWPLEEWDTDFWLPKIHAVEFLGEPQYGGGRPVPPQEVFDKLLPYRVGRLATSVTHSEERIWRYYAGLSDFPHFDAYRVVAPAADAWREYDRWNGKRISWGAPLETIGDLCRSLRELNRPMPCAHWSQGPGDGWGDDFFSPRKRRSPTPAELRSQAVHALSTRITSLYWFNLSLKSLLKFPDTWEAIAQIGREIRMLEPYYLEGGATWFERRVDQTGRPDWDLSTIAAPSVAVLFANDTAYAIDLKQNTFVFGPARVATFRFTLPGWLKGPSDVFRVDAEGIHEVDWRIDGGGVIVGDRRSLDAIYIASKSKTARLDIERRRQSAITHELANPVDRPALEAILRTRQ